MKLTVSRHSFPLRVPFSIMGYTFHSTDAVHVSLEQDGTVGRGEGIGVYYNNDSADSIETQLEAIAPQLEAGLDRESQRCTERAGAEKISESVRCFGDFHQKRRNFFAVSLVFLS